MVEQHIEAEIGLATAEAYADLGDGETVAWDSGSGSFQISTRTTAGASQCDGSAAVTGSVLVYSGQLGTSPSAKLLLDEVTAANCVELP